MNKSFYPLVFVCFVLVSCTIQQTGGSFQTKADSIQFAKTVLQLYPELDADQQPPGDTSALLNPGKGFQPIPWDTVMSYKTYYDQDPKIFNLLNQPYKGFSIDPKGYKMLLSNKKIKGLYLRLGRKGDGAYTLIVMGTDSTGKTFTKNFAAPRTLNLLAPKDTSDYDNLEPCPINCPGID